MANTVDVRLLEAGPVNVILQVFLQSDGASGDLVNYTLLDPVLSLPGHMTPRARLNLRRIEYNIAGFDAMIGFGNTTPTPTRRWVISEGTNSPVDFEWMGGLFDDDYINGNGKVVMSTYGFTSSTDIGAILIKLVKRGGQ